MVIGLVDETILVRVVFSQLMPVPALAGSQWFSWPVHATPESQRRQPKQSLCRTDATDGNPNSIS